MIFHIKSQNKENLIFIRFLFKKGFLGRPAGRKELKNIKKYDFFKDFPKSLKNHIFIDFLIFY